MFNRLYLYLHWQAANISAEMQYKKNFFISIFAVFLQPIISLASIYIFTSKFTTLGGWNFWQATFLYSVWRIVDGVAMMLFSQSWEIDTYIRNGSFDRFLLRPVNPLFQLFCIKFQKVSLSQTVAGVIFLILSASNIGIKCKLVDALYLLVAIIAGALLYMGVSLSFSSLSFWFVKVSNIITVVTSFNYEFMQYPMSIYPLGLQIVLTFILPYAFMSYIPCQYFLGPANMIFPEWIIYISPIVGVGVFLLSILVFSLGINHYNSTGN